MVALQFREWPFNTGLQSAGICFTTYKVKSHVRRTYIDVCLVFFSQQTAAYHRTTDITHHTTILWSGELVNIRPIKTEIWIQKTDVHWQEASLVRVLVNRPFSPWLRGATEGPAEPEWGLGHRLSVRPCPAVKPAPHSSITVAHPPRLGVPSTVGGLSQINRPYTACIWTLGPAFLCLWWPSLKFENPLSFSPSLTCFLSSGPFWEGKLIEEQLRE